MLHTYMQCWRRSVLLLLVLWSCFSWAPNPTNAQEHPRSNDTPCANSFRIDLHLLWGAKAKLVDAKTYNNQVKHNLSALGVSTVGTLSMNKYELAKKINELEGLTNEEKSELLKLLRSQKKYGLVWEDKPEDAELRMVNEQPVLVEVPERAIVSDDAEAPNHILIEGDNLEALTALSYTHSGKIDVIYIDPPYNTGNKDFVYNDSFVDKEDGYRHSKWLSFMNKRLKIAKSLLSEKGVIFISCDDNEQAPLKMLCDEIFGEANFFTNLIWQSTPGSNTGKTIKTVTEYVLMYAKQKVLVDINSKPVEDTKKYKFSDEYLEHRGPYLPNKLDRRMTGSHYSEALNYPIQTPDGTMLYPGCSTEKQEHWNWRWSKQKVEWGISNGFILFNQKNGKWAIYFKQYLNVDNNDVRIERALPYQNLVLEDAMNAARVTREVMDIFSEKKFDYPKPLSLLTFVLKMVSKADTQMLDFDNQPLRNLIAVGRNKGLSIILATQNMDSFKSKFFDFYANAQYPLIMKQQTIADGIIKDLFGVSGKDFQEIKSAIAGLQKGELIIKDNTIAALGLGSKTYKKIKVTHLI